MKAEGYAAAPLRNNSREVDVLVTFCTHFLIINTEILHHNSLSHVLICLFFIMDNTGNITVNTSHAIFTDSYMVFL
jgi:hypothetical protein